MSSTAYWEKRVFDAVFHGVSFTVAQAYVGLGVTDLGPPVVYYELTVSDYRRQPVVWGAALEDGSIASAQQVTWTPTSSWGTVTAAFLFDAAQGGNRLLETTIGTVPMGSGSQIYIDPGSLTVT